MASLPETLKPITSLIKLANDTQPRDAVVAYWLRVYTVQKALKIDSKSPEARKFLMELMDKLEKVMCTPNYISCLLICLSFS